MARSTKTDGGGIMPGAEISDELVSKVGRAIVQIAEIKQAHKMEFAAAQTSDEEEELSQRVNLEAVNAISDQGLSPEQYNEVVTAADGDPELERRLLTAARAA